MLYILLPKNGIAKSIESVWFGASLKQLKLVMVFNNVLPKSPLYHSYSHPE
jgi:hypothetical protein